MFSGNADWYVLDENLNRRVRLEEEMLEEISAAMEANEDQYVEIEEGKLKYQERFTFTFAIQCKVFQDEVSRLTPHRGFLEH